MGNIIRKHGLENIAVNGKIRGRAEMKRTGTKHYMSCHKTEKERKRGREREREGERGGERERERKRGREGEGE